MKLPTCGGARHGQGIFPLHHVILEPALIMSHSIKRKSPPLSPGSADKEALGKAEDRPRKKGKQRDQPRREPRPKLPTRTYYLPFVLGGSHWRGKNSLETIVIFGDSYSKPNEVDDESDTWVEHVARRSRKESPIRVSNFAFPGATVEDDLSRQFLSFTRGLRGVPLDSERTTYFIYLGINDCGRTPSDDLEPMVEAVFDILHDLYTKFSARNFVLIDVPPIDRSAGAMESNSIDDIKERVRTWNELLRTQANDFAKGSIKATVFIFSSHHVLTEVLDKPLDFDFAEGDPETEGAGIWADELHLTSAVHAIFAEYLWNSLVEP
ncbi:hypothetical protein BDM02DRAFT_961937 [Thelephora ganbajun]|uniref:Uncharacterized protein n=1 Tax=Thelephora ganbajun TaxID=370292 RepID=A0ACB6ZNB6_THEGA|nr:hypothetical protein BDM02DRAFT_961937 [Thelephora ganbajun]